jgi:hypothetical protein
MWPRADSLLTTACMALLDSAAVPGTMFTAMHANVPPIIWYGLQRQLVVVLPWTAW